MYEININICAKLSFFGLSARTSKKSFKNDLREPPRPLPPGGKSTKNGPKTRQKGSKTVPRALNTTFHLPLSHPERPPEADLAPKTP